MSACVVDQLPNGFLGIVVIYFLTLFISFVIYPFCKQLLKLKGRKPMKDKLFRSYLILLVIIVVVIIIAFVLITLRGGFS